MFVLFMILWIIFNGKVTVEIILVGVLICAWLYWFTHKYMNYSRRSEKIILMKIPQCIKYFFILFGEIIKANFAVISIILSSKKEIQPDIMSYKTDLKSDLARVVLANSITLTPGTYTIQFEDENYLIHTLDKSFQQELNETVFTKELLKLEARAYE